MLIAAVFTFSGCKFNNDQNEKIVKVTGGKISGFSDENGLNIYKGIPFAAPPVGDLRWKAPQPVTPWKGVKECTDFGPSPMQNEPKPFMFWSSEFLIPKKPISEDCLYLNVWSGATSSEEKRPVLVYIYGGGFNSGGAGCAIYDGTNMAKKGIVFVSFNYRVGPFGFFAHPELSKEAAYGTSGNYGILDMIAALKWVQENIASFGGDPDNVTIAGQSAGAFGVNYLTASPLAKGLFQKAIAQSGGRFLTNRNRGNMSLKMAENLGEQFAKNLGANSLQKLRNLSAKEIQNGQNPMNLPILDGYALSQTIYNTYAEGKQHDIPMLLGWNDNDIVMGPPANEEDFRKMVNRRFKDLKAEFYAAYPSVSPAQIKKTQFEINRDEIFGTQVYTWGKMQDKTGSQPVYMYNFNRALPAHTPETQFGAFHSGEIAYAYDNLHTLDRPWEEVDHEIADKMSSYWANFITTGDPNGKDLPEWKPFTNEDKLVQVIDQEIESKRLPDEKKLKFWENYYTIP